MAAANLRLKVLMGLAAAVGVYVIATSGGADDGVVDASPARSGSTRPATAAVQTLPVSEEEQLLAQPAGRNVSSTQGTMSTHSASALLVRLKHRVAANSDSGALFQKQSWYVPPPPPAPLPTAQLVNTPPPAPTAPPMPFGVMGSYARPGDAKVYFLTRGDRVFDVRVGDTIDGTYTVDAETRGLLVMTYMPLNIQQSIALEDSP
jgi:hypothetical protein